MAGRRGEKAHPDVDPQGRKLDVFAANVKGVSRQPSHLNDLSGIGLGGFQYLLAELIQVELFQNFFAAKSKKRSESAWFRGRMCSIFRGSQKRRESTPSVPVTSREIHWKVSTSRPERCNEPSE